MIHVLAAGSSGFAANIGSILSGVSELLLALGGGMAFLLKNRRDAKRERARAEAAAALAAQQVKRTLEEKIENQYSAQFEQNKSQLEAERQAHMQQIDLLKNQIKDLQSVNARLMARLLEGQS